MQYKKTVDIIIDSFSLLSFLWNINNGTRIPIEPPNKLTIVINESISESAVYLYNNKFIKYNNINDE